MGYARFDERRHAIRASYDDAVLHNSLGLSKLDPSTVRQLPALVFLNKSRECRMNARAHDGKLVLPLSFDHSRRIPALPDHVMSGLISNFINACFSFLESDE